MTKTAPRPAPKPKPPPTPKPPTLAEQKADFTAEGSPPPGKVSTTVPEVATHAPKPPPA